MLNKELETKKDALLKFFDTLDDDYWKTLEDIANATHIDAATVSKIVTDSGDFVRSSYRVKQGEPLYTSRDNFRDKAPIVDKVIGAFKNRID